MSDRREELFIKHHDVGTDACGDRIEFLDKQDAFNAMDEYMKECCLELLTYVVKRTTGHSIDREGNVTFKYMGEWITREQLFENFL